MELALYAPGLGYYSAGAQQVRRSRRLRHRARSSARSSPPAWPRAWRRCCSSSVPVRVVPGAGRRHRRVRRSRAQATARTRRAARPLRDPRTQRAAARAPARAPAAAPDAAAVRTGGMARRSAAARLERRAVRQRSDRCAADAALRHPGRRGLRGARGGRRRCASRACCDRPMRSSATRCATSSAGSNARSTTATARKCCRSCRTGSRPCPAACSAARCCSSTTAIRAASSTCPTAATARCARSTAIACTSEPLLWPGLQDLTASVDFTALAEAGVAAGFDFAGYCSQASFLLGNGMAGVLERIERIARRGRAPAPHATKSSG